MKINNCNEFIVDSGLLRDVQEFIKTIAQPQNSQNIVLLKDITKQILKHLQTINNSDVPDDLVKLLPNDKIKPFSPPEHIKDVNSLIADAQIDTVQYLAKLNKILAGIESRLVANKDEIGRLRKVLLPYYEKGKELRDKAVMSLVFKDSETISNLKTFVKILNRWERTLFIYHRLVSSKSPEETKLINIQNGSLDVVVNINIDVAINLVELMKFGFVAFSGYLLYKKKKQEIIETFLGNKKLIKRQEEEESLMLDNLGEAIKENLENQHKTSLKKDKGIDKESVPKKIESVVEVLSEHIVKGNDVKLLIDFDTDVEEGEESENDKRRILSKEVKKVSLKVRNYLKELPSGETKLLIEKYTIKDSKGTQDSIT